MFVIQSSPYEGRLETGDWRQPFLAGEMLVLKLIINLRP